MIINYFQAELGDLVVSKGTTLVRASISEIDGSNFISAEQISAVHSYTTEMKSELSLAKIGWPRRRRYHVVP